MSAKEPYISEKEPIYLQKSLRVCKRALYIQRETNVEVQHKHRQKFSKVSSLLEFL